MLISANDPDESVNHTLSIYDEELTPFTIDKYTGQISLRQKLDREKESSYRLRVRVSDGTWAVQTGAAITVLDVNDNAPVFEKDRYVFIVNRLQVNQSIGRIQTTDADEGMNGVVHYRFDKDRCLSIDVISGDLRLLCVPHRGVITITVTAQDNGMQAMTSTTVVTVVFPTGSKTECGIPVNIGTINGTLLTRLAEYCNDDVNEKV
ncbi:unnamed protein product [Cylicocyclus nassatus]|uniref:Cadherin domain-containing protein n=1 Tax=Cylicocyclus nassatus TaxID=53992 RepID=A0AA36GWW0_CYLNA|nr:unnamed protein product [Cylicocyclus nassatus]